MDKASSEVGSRAPRGLAVGRDDTITGHVSLRPLSTVLLRTAAPAFQAACRGFDPRLPLHSPVSCLGRHAACGDRPSRRPVDVAQSRAVTLNGDLWSRHGSLPEDDRPSDVRCASHPARRADRPLPSRGRPPTRTRRRTRPVRAPSRPRRGPGGSGRSSRRSGRRTAHCRAGQHQPRYQESAYAVALHVERPGRPAPTKHMKSPSPPTA